MTVRTKYRTKQRKILMEYFEANPQTHMTVKEICDYFRSHDISCGQATVYRQLESLVNDGIIRKYVIDENSPACYEYLGEKEEDHDLTFHCKCEKCGKLIHIQCHRLQDLQQHLKKGHGFTVNPLRTVLYGLCEQCRKQ
ncbi:MAG: transcriptional repressor [Erysipelotrichaceae bacterium]|nr:transcriptional repressor [Erysipelotrichaceae bacterium]